MYHNNLFKIVLIALFIQCTVCTVMNADRASSKEDSERFRIKELIERAIVTDQELDEKSKKGLLPLNQHTIPVLIEYSLNKVYTEYFRNKSLLFLTNIADDRILEPFTEYYRNCIKDSLKDKDKPCELSTSISKTLASYYVRSKDERAIKIFIEWLKDDVPGQYKLRAVKTLGLCQDVKSAEILKRLVINNWTYPYQYHQALAARAVVDMGDDSVLPNVIVYARFILDDSILGKGEGRGFAAHEGVRALAILAKRNDVANQALQKIMQTFITDTHHYYVYRDEDFSGIGESLIPAFASVGRKENVRFLEQMLGKSDHQLMNQQIVNSLGKIGDERTIGVLEKYNRYPDDVKKAIARIQKRLPTPKKFTK